jgi:ribosomal protein L33
MSGNTDSKKALDNSAGILIVIGFCLMTLGYFGNRALFVQVFGNYSFYAEILMVIGGFYTLYWLGNLISKKQTIPKTVLSKSSDSTQQNLILNKYCPSCGRELRDNTPFCPFCGSSLKKDVI